MEVKIEELKKGDEVIISSGSQLKYLKLLNNPIESINPPKWGSIPGKKYFKSIKCTARRESITRTYTNWKGIPYTFIRNEYQLSSPEEHNITVHQNFNHKTIWLVNREI